MYSQGYWVGVLTISSMCIPDAVVGATELPFRG